MIDCGAVHRGDLGVPREAQIHRSEVFFTHICLVRGLFFCSRGSAGRLLYASLLMESMVCFFLFLSSTANCSHFESGERLLRPPSL